MPRKTAAKPAPIKTRGPRGGGTVYERPDGLWVAERTIQGVRTRRTGKTESLAQARLARAIGTVPTRPGQVSADPLLAADPFVSDYLHAWIESKRGELRDRTRIGYQRIINAYLIPALGSVRLHDLDRAMAQQMLNDLAASGKAPGTRRNVRNCLSGALTKAVEDGVLPRNPISGLTVPAAGDRFLVRVSARDFRQVLDAVRDSLYRDLYSLLLYTGCRLGEALGLDWADVRLADRTITIHRTDTLVERDDHLVRGFGVPKTKSGRRVVGLPDEAVRLLWSRYHAEHDPKRGLVFGSARDPKLPLSPSDALRRFKDALEKAGLPPMRLHDLRHWNATWLLSRGVPVASVSRALGHRSPEITYRLYAGVLTDEMRQQVETLRFFPDAPKRRGGRVVDGPGLENQ